MLPRVSDIQHEDDNVCRPLTSKVCKGCKLEKDVSLFYFNKTRGTYFAECKLCNIKRSSKWNSSNKEQYKVNCKAHRKRNPETYRKYKKKEYYKNIERYKTSSKKYRNSSHGKSLRLALSRQRELAKINATPPWLTKEQAEQMKQFYRNRPEGYHVDHIIPIKGHNVCGLHVPWNLQYLPAVDNIKKGNKLIELKK